MKLSNQHMVKWATILIFLFASACSSLDKNVVTEITVTSTITSLIATTRSTALPTNTLVPKSTPILDSTSIPTQRETPTTKSTDTIIPTATATLEPATTPIPLLTIKHPSVGELETYLTSIASDKFPFYSPFTENVELVYVDVSGDGQDDLIISDFLLASVFVWKDDHYREPFLYQGYPFKYDPGSRVYLEDWTNDSVPEIVFDYRDDIGGTGARHTDWKKFVIHCSQKNSAPCKVIWGGNVTAFSEDYNAGGLALYQTSIEHTINDNTVTLVITTNSFVVYSLGLYVPPSVGDGTLFFRNNDAIEVRLDNYLRGVHNKSREHSPNMRYIAQRQLPNRIDNHSNLNSQSS